MYSLKVLSGENTGKIFPLHSVENIIGRAPNCDVVIPNKNISKQHAKVIVDQKRVLFTDLNSTNGSFINGVKVEVSLLKPGDKILLYDTLIEVVTDRSAPKFKVLPGGAEENSENHEDYELKYASSVDQFIHNLNVFLEKSVMPPFYIALNKIDFKWLVGFLLFLTIFLTTLLSTIPLMNIIQDSVELESKRRALSLAKTLATINSEPLRSNQLSGVSVALGEREPGVNKALIIKQVNGEIIAPARMSGQFVDEPIVHAARKITDKPSHVFKLDSKTILAMHPVKLYNPGSGLESVEYYSVIYYNANALSVSGSKTFSLIVQTLFLSLLAGLIIFYFLVKIIEYPFVEIRRDIKSSLQSYNGEITTPILFAPLQETYIALSSLLNRVFHNGNIETNPQSEVDRSMEVQNLISMLGYASLIISNSDESILDYNPLFEELTNLYDLKGQKISEISDQALQQNLQDLIERSRLNPDEITENDLEFSGIPYVIRTHPIYGSSDISYFVCSFFPAEDIE